MIDYVIFLTFVILGLAISMALPFGSLSEA